MLEKRIEKKLGDKLKAAGFLYYKFVAPGNDGVPDRIAIAPDGRLYFLELKTMGGTLSQVQGMQIGRLKAHRQDVRVIRGMQGAEDFIREATGHEM
jgi:hypothetical protein